MNELTGWLQRLTAGRDRAVVVGAAVTAAWLLLVALFWLFGPEGGPVSGLARLMTLVGVFLPVALIWPLQRREVMVRAAPGRGFSFDW